MRSLAFILAACAVRCSLADCPGLLNEPQRSAKLTVIGAAPLLCFSQTSEKLASLTAVAAPQIACGAGLARSGREARPAGRRASAGSRAGRLQQVGRIKARQDTARQREQKCL